ncbi:hypothetical protein MTO96_028377 [Rhipicephalus appendiculatus]
MFLLTSQDTHRFALPLRFRVPQGKPWFEQYSWSIYNAISQMVSCGYGRTPAASVADAWFMCLGMASGTVGYALLLGLCASTIQTMDYSRRLLREKLKEVEDYMQCQKFPSKLRSRMRDYFENRYEGRVFDEAKILASLSDPLREEIVNHSIRTTVRTVPFFAQSEPTFIAELVSRLRHEFFQPGDLIVKQDTVGHKMYFLQSGKVNIVHDNGEFVASAYPGAYFGEMCLLTRARRQANVVAETYCNVLSLSDEDFQRALEKHPLMRRAMEALCAEQGTQVNPAALTSSLTTLTPFIEPVVSVPASTVAPNRVGRLHANRRRGAPAAFSRVAVEQTTAAACRVRVEAAGGSCARMRGRGSGPLASAAGRLAKMAACGSVRGRR